MKILRREAVEDKIGRRHSWIYAKIADGSFPAPIKLGAAGVGWLEHEVDAWIEQRVVERDSAKAAA